MNTINTFFGTITCSEEKKKEKLNAFNTKLNHSEQNDLQDIINVVNDVVKATTNGTSSVENLKDLKDFLNQAIPAWQNAMMNQTVFQQQFYQFPPRT